jgi:protein TonB
MHYSEVWQPPHGSRRTAEAIISFTVQEDGSVADASVFRATNPEVGRAALEAVKKWRFEPATSHGAPARFQMKVPIVADLSNTTFITR